MSYPLAALLRAIAKIPREHLYCYQCALRGSPCTCPPSRVIPDSSTKP